MTHGRVRRAENRETNAGTPQGGILSPLLANIALSVLDEHLHGPWQAGGSMATRSTGWVEGSRPSGWPTSTGTAPGR